jgi:hypothetical protein
MSLPALLLSYLPAFLLPYLPALVAFGSLFFALFIGGRIDRAWRHLDVFDKTPGHSSASVWARLKGVGAFYGAILFAPLVGTGALLWRLYAGSEYPASLWSLIEFGVLLYFVVLLGLLWKKDWSKKNAVQPSASIEPSTSCSDVHPANLSVGTTPTLLVGFDSVASAVLVSAQTVHMVASKVGQGQQIPSSVQEVLTLSQKNLGLALQAILHPQVSERNPGNESKP